MGMYDDFKSSYYLGVEFTNVPCQTKDLDCTMSFYWLDPDGVLWEPSYVGTSTIQFLTEDDPDYNEKLLFLNYKTVPTGKKGRVSICRFTGAVNIYRSDWHKNQKELCLLFKDGVINTYVEVS